MMGFYLGLLCGGSWKQLFPATACVSYICTLFIVFSAARNTNCVIFIDKRRILLRKQLPHLSYPQLTHVGIQKNHTLGRAAISHLLVEYF